MKYLILCEGANERDIIDLLLDNNKLTFKKDDLIGYGPYHARQLNNTIKSELKHYNKQVNIIRIGDTQKDILDISSDISHIVSKDRIYSYCTKPEIEMLLIINENMYDDYNKRKNKIKAKDYAKQNIVYNGWRYDNTCEFYKEYYKGKRINKLVDNIREYKRIKTHKNKKELYLADLLK